MPTFYKFKNNFTGALLGVVSSTTATTITVTALTGDVPTEDDLTGGYGVTFYVDSEFMLVTAISGSTWTVSRGYGGSTAATHASGAAIGSANLAQALNGLIGAAGGTVGTSADSGGVSKANSFRIGGPTSNALLDDDGSGSRSVQLAFQAGSGDGVSVYYDDNLGLLVMTGLIGISGINGTIANQPVSLGGVLRVENNLVYTTQTGVTTGTYTPVIDRGIIHKMGTLTGNLVIAAPTITGGGPAISDGELIVLTLRTSATGSQTVTWNSAFKFGNAAGGTSLATAATTILAMANNNVRFTFSYDTTDSGWVCTDIKYGY